MAVPHTAANASAFTRVQAMRAGRVPADALERVRRELRTPRRYTLAEPSVALRQTWWQLLLRWIGERWDALWTVVSARVHVGRSAERVVGDGLILLFVLIIGVLGARLLTALQWRRDERDVALSALTPHASAHALFMRANAAAERGEFPAAVRLLFAAAVTLLDVRGVMHDDASATVNELRRTLASSDDAVVAPFVTIADAYTAAAYAEVQVGFDAWNNAMNAYERLARNAVMP